MKTNKSIIIGIDTHKATHVAVAIDTQGARLAALSIPANTKGYSELERWSRSLGNVLAFGIEGTGSYGAGLSRSLLSQGNHVVEVTRPNRQLRYSQGKSDSLDAEGAARSVLSGQATACPKTQNGSSEMIRHMKIARDTAVKSRSQAMVTLKTLIINAPADLRDVLDQIKGKVALIRHIAAFRPGAIDNTTASAKAAMRALARRWLMLHEEILAHDKELEHLIAKRAPELLASHGIATLTVAEMLILVGDDPSRIRSEAAFAKLCGVCPIPASSGKTHRFRLNRGGNRQANAALYRVAIVRMRSHKPTLAYVKKRTKDGKSKSEIIRCLKRYIVREIYSQLCRPKIAQTAA
jgi:transposase